MSIKLSEWNGLEKEERTALAMAALFPPPISIDAWAGALSVSSVRILQIAEKMVGYKILRRHRPLGIGYYFFNSVDIIQDILNLTDDKEIDGHARALIAYAKANYQTGPKRFMTLAHIYQISKIPPTDPDSLLLAAQYCIDFNLRKDAAEYYKLAIESLPDHQDEPGEKTVFIDAAIRLVSLLDMTIAFPKQEQIFDLSLSYARELNDPERLAKMLTHIGLLNLWKNKVDSAVKVLEEAKRIADKHGEAGLIKHVTLVSSTCLMWLGRPAEAVVQFEGVLGNLEQLPSDEAELVACADLAWAYGKCGQTEHGLALANAVLHKAKELDQHQAIAIVKLWTASILHDAFRKAEAEPIIDGLLSSDVESIGHVFPFILYLFKAYELSYKGEYEAASEMLSTSLKYRKMLGLLHYWGAIHFECMDILEGAGFVNSEMNLKDTIELAINGNDILLQGIGYYYRANYLLKNQGPAAAVQDALEKSLSLLKKSGAKIDLARCQLAMARLYFQDGRDKEAVSILNEAWNILKFVNEQLFPVEFMCHVNRENKVFLPEPLIEISQTLGTIRNRHELLNQIISLTMRLTGAGRGAFFGRGKENSMDLIASRNIAPLSPDEPFNQQVLSKINQVMDTGNEIILSRVYCKNAGDICYRQPGWQIIYPVKLRGKLMGCFFLERNLDGYEMSESILSMLKVISAQVAVALDNVKAYEEIAELKDQYEAETIFYRSEPSNINHAFDIVGESPGVKKVISSIINVANSATTVLITGETGVGKELVAKAIHQLSDRSDGPFIPVSISSLNEGIVTSELFGHEKGAFTNAMHTRRGRFELAKSGSLFLDEINSLSLDMQARLLRVLETKKFERVGGSTTIESDFRLIAACNQPLDQLVEKGNFRADLFYRLNVYPIDVPPLRERNTDIPLLVRHFINLMARKHNKKISEITRDAMECLLGYHWPGNVRELKHTIERALLTCEGKKIKLSDINLRKTTTMDAKDNFLTLKDMERHHIIMALSRCNWKVSGKDGAAQMLGVNPNTLFTKINRLGIKKSISVTPLAPDS